MTAKLSNCQLFYKKEHIQSKITPLKKGQLDYLSIYYVTSTWILTPNSNLQMNYLNSCYLGNQNIIQSAISQKNAYSTKRAYSMQTISFQEDKIWVIFNIFYTIYICYTNTKIIVLKTPD